MNIKKKVEGLVSRPVRLTGSSNDEDGKVPESWTDDLVEMIGSSKGKQNNEDDRCHQRWCIAIEFKVHPFMLVGTHVM